jgi:thioredoxin-like negative regulator of GroEL
MVQGVHSFVDICSLCVSVSVKIYAEKGKKIRVGAINSRVYHEVADEHKVTSWPWVTSFYRGQKIEDMAGLGGWESVYKFAIRIYDKVYSKNPPPNVFLDSPWSTQNQAAAAEATGSSEEAAKEEL